MVALAANLSADQEWIPLSSADALSLPVGYYTIDTENVFVDTGAHRADSISRPTYDGRRARRGVGGSTAATHLSGATLTAYDPEAPSGDGGGSGIPQGGPLTEPLDAGTFGITGLAFAIDIADATPLEQVTELIAAAQQGLDDVLGVDNDGDGLAITNLADPDDPQDAATKAYVDANAVAALADPGNVWEAETAVIAGYRIANGTSVWEVDDPGTTDTVEPDFTITPEKATDGVTDATVTWVWIGVIGMIPRATLGLDGDLTHFLTGTGEMSAVPGAPSADNVPAIADPGTASAEDVADKINAVIAALIDAGLMGD